MKTLLCLSGTLLLLACAPAPVYAQTSPPPPVVVTRTPPPPPPREHHPAYLRALGDLRHARALLARPANARVQWDEQRAIAEIDGAIREIREAAIDDGKDVNDHPPVDVGGEWGGRLQRAGELVRQARADVDREEDNDFARGLKHRAVERMDRALGFIDEGIAAHHMGPPPPPAPPPAPPPPPPAHHPAYLHALDDLRFARALLERPANFKAKFDEQVAVREIDGAIREIKEASIEDGKNLNDHPPVDVRADWRGRLHQALDALRRARADINQEEDNQFARGLKARAIRRIDTAIGYTEAGIHDMHY